MPARHVRALASIAATLLIGGAATAVGMGRRSPVRSVPVTPASIEPPAPSETRTPGPTRIWRSAVIGTLALLFLFAAGLYAFYEAKAANEMRTRAVALTAGDPDRGRELAQRYGCAGCHTIPGVPRAQGKVGPSLEGFAARVYIAGITTNTPDSLIQWIQNPRSLDPKTAMPITGISSREARHVAAYLYTLR
ncbi:MAG TPA: c-type cytochrome [Microvirga sp.]|jgi:cytochrome c2|nr:c-type cytochrome [Microvirga sp.]